VVNHVFGAVVAAARPSRRHELPRDRKHREFGDDHVLEEGRLTWHVKLFTTLGVVDVVNAARVTAILRETVQEKAGKHQTFTKE
jgi:hypothetical protein